MKELLLKEMETQEEFLKDTLATHENKTIEKALRIEYLIGGWTALNNLLFEIDKPKAVELCYQSMDLLTTAKTTIGGIIKKYTKTKNRRLKNGN